MNAADLLTNRTRLTPDRIAVVDADSGARFTYADINGRANRLANFMLSRCGVRKGDRVCLLAENSIVCVDMLYGLMKIGAVFTPLNWRLTDTELDVIAADCTPHVFVGSRSMSERTVRLAQRYGAAVFIIDSNGENGQCSYDDELMQASESEPSRPEIDADDACALLYTSGTTGTPKGAVIPHRQILWNCISTVISWGLSESDTAPILTPMFHAGGLFVFLTPLLYAGGRIVLTHAFDPAASLRLIERERCTVILGVPTMFRLWMTTEEYTHSNLSHVRWFINGGAPCPDSIITAWHEQRHIVVRQGYGLTEAGVNCFSMTNEEAVSKIGSVGKPIMHSAMRVLDADGHVANAGEQGELCIRGPHVTTGYWNNSAATASALRDGWFHTGDIASRDDDGCYYIVGRLKDMIISGGENIYAAEVEKIFRNHPAVADAALIGRPDETWGEAGVLFVVRRAGLDVSVEELMEFSGRCLARYKIPKEIIFIAELPCSPYGKVMKHVLKEQYHERGRR